MIKATEVLIRGLVAHQMCLVALINSTVGRNQLVSFLSKSTWLINYSTLLYLLVEVERERKREMGGVGYEREWEWVEWEAREI